MLISFFIGGKNMTIKECIDIVDNLKPNQYSIKEKVMWLSFIDEVIINDVLKTHEGYDGIYDDFTGYSEDKLSVRLIVTSPYDRLYPAYLKMKIDSENGETARYNNSVALFNSYMMEFRKYYNKTHMPLDITKPRASSKGDYEGGSSNTTVVPAKDAVYNIVDEYMNDNIDKFTGKNGASAYIVAVNNGFEGTEEEWLEQLSGVYVGSGEMPVGYSVQIDPEGDTVDIETYATKDYVENKIGDIDIDLSDYATKDYVDTAIIQSHTHETVTNDDHIKGFVIYPDSHYWTTLTATLVDASGNPIPNGNIYEGTQDIRLKSRNATADGEIIVHCDLDSTIDFSTAKLILFGVLYSGEHVELGELSTYNQAVINDAGYFVQTFNTKNISGDTNYYKYYINVFVENGTDEYVGYYTESYNLLDGGYDDYTITFSISEDSADGLRRYTLGSGVLFTTHNEYSSMFGSTDENGQIVIEKSDFTGEFPECLFYSVMPSQYGMQFINMETKLVETTQEQIDWLETKQEILENGFKQVEEKVYDIADYIVAQGTVNVPLYGADWSTSIGVSMPICYRIFNSGIKEIFFSQNNQNFESLTKGMYAAFKTSDLPFSISKCISSISSISNDNATIQNIGIDVTHSVNLYDNGGVIELYTTGEYHDGFRKLNGHLVFE